MAEIGTVIEGKYEILKVIGKGGMSKVYLAMDNNLNKQWGIKEIVREARDRNNEVIVQKRSRGSQYDEKTRSSLPSETKPQMKNDK